MLMPWGGMQLGLRAAEIKPTITDHLTSACCDIHSILSLWTKVQVSKESAGSVGK